jgi:membrane protein DedA with SNARE-associated domain
MTTYGAAVLGFVLLLGALGVPVPGTLMVLAAGAFARQGAIDWRAALLIGLLGAVIGDSASYAMGCFANGWVQQRFGQSVAWQTAQHRFAQRGILAVYATRFLFTPLAIPTNLIAGGSGYNFQRFFTYDVAGEFTWLVLYGGLGYAFGSQWSTLSQAINSYSGYLVGLLAIGIAGYFVIRNLRGYIGRYTGRYFKKFSNYCNDSAQNLDNYPVYCG